MANYSQLKAAIADVIKTNGTKAITGQVLQDVLNSMVSVIGANYTFAGVATPTTNPGTPDQNVVYMASEAGTYTNFGAVVLPTGIHLLKWNGGWSTQTFFTVDNEPTVGSHNLVESGGVFEQIHSYRSIDFIKDEYKYDVRITSGNKWQVNPTTGYGYVLPIISGVKYKVVAPDSSIQIAILHSLDNIDVNGGNPDFCDDYPNRIIVESDSTFIFIAPNDAEYIYLLGESTAGVLVYNFYETVISNQFKTGEDVVNVGIDDEPTAGSDNLVKSGGAYNVKRMSLQNTSDISEQTFLTPYESDEGYRCKPNSTTGLAELVSSTYNTVKKYNICGGKIYNISGKYRSSISTYLYIWVDANGMATNGEIKGVNGQVDEWDDITIETPEGATELWMNADTYYLDDSTLVSVGDTIKSRDLLKAISETISTPLTPYETDEGYRSRPNSITGLAELVSNSGITVRKYNVVGGNNYTFSGEYGEQVNLYVFIWVDANGIATNGEYKGTEGKDVWENIPIVAPMGATELWMNVQNLNADKFNLNSIESEVIDFVELKQQVQQNTEDIVELSDRMNSLTNSLMKVVITGNEAAEDTPFYVRSRYNDEKDIIITHRINQNLLITFKEIYIGANTLTDEQLMTNDYLVSTHTDSTSPLRTYTQYWHLFAQHGYLVPYFANSIGMTSADVGALWKDQLDREYHIGKVTTEYVWLLPVIYQDANGHYTRDWHSKATSADITNLTYVSGGSTGKYTSPISLSTYSQEQLRPIMKVENRTYVIDGVEVSNAGTYYCNEFCVNETETGYDPATISDWFGGEDGKPNLTGAQEHIVFTYSYNYKGAQCAVYTTMHCLREAKGYYGGTQQQFFFDKGDYKAMFMIPKAAARDGIELDKPFNSPSSSSTGYVINRTAAHLKDVDDPVDRQIGMLHNPNDNTYLVGMASGLSLVVGDTIKTRRNQICLENSLLLYFSPSNTNKFYVSGINTSAFESEYYPAGYFKEVDYYVSYFDPAENVGQVYWYKDGSRYIIYAHCQSVQNVLAINVPEFMDGLNLSVVEKTSDTDLLSDTIQNGKFFLNYNTADANYIVLIAE